MKRIAILRTVSPATASTSRPRSIRPSWARDTTSRGRFRMRAPAELARRVGSKTGTVSMRLGRLAERGEVERIDGKWRVVEENPPKPALATARA
jgi:DNA-binding MarR family transcriptional regulator